MPLKSLPLLGNPLDSWLLRQIHCGVTRCRLWLQQSCEKSRWCFSMSVLPARPSPVMEVHMPTEYKHALILGCKRNQLQHTCPQEVLFLFIGWQQGNLWESSIDNSAIRQTDWIAGTTSHIYVRQSLSWPFRCLVLQSDDSSISFFQTSFRINFCGMPQIFRQR